MVEIDFFTTDGCHLCNEALALCEPFKEAGIIKINCIDIVDEEHLVELYGIRIPVIKRRDSNLELGWPFDQQILQKFLVA